MHPLDDRFSTALKAAESAGEIIKKAREANQFAHEYKDHNELVTTTDKEVDQFLINTLKQAFPEDFFLTEETYDANQAQKLDFEGATWVIDPIDGTVNFAYGHPQVAVSIALVINKEVQLGIVHCPFLNETFHAIKHKGAFLNNTAIQVRPCNQVKDAIIASGLPYDKSRVASLLPNLNKAMLNGRDIRRNGSAAIDLCWVACGRLQAYFETVQPWDMAAGNLIAKEAGAFSGHYHSENPSSKTPLIEDLNSYNLFVCSPGISMELSSMLGST